MKEKAPLDPGLEKLTSAPAYRRRFEDIYASMLDACGNGAKKTRIMYGSMLNFRQLNRYLRVLLDKGFVKSEREGHYFVTTSKGSYYLEGYARMVASQRAMYALHTELLSMLSSPLGPAQGGLKIKVAGG